MVMALRRGGLNVFGRCGAMIAVALGTTACASIQNMAPDPASFRLPDRSTFLPSNINSYSFPAPPSGPAAASELVDSQGQCAGVAPSAGTADGGTAAQRGVSLQLTECEVVRRLGAPQATEITQPGGQRLVVLTYTVGERAGIYRFADGRLASIERGAEPPPPPPDAKKPAKKPKTAT
jgi:hypothetical protein